MLRPASLNGVGPQSAKRTHHIRQQARRCEPVVNCMHLL